MMAYIMYFTAKSACWQNQVIQETSPHCSKCITNQKNVLGEVLMCLDPGSGKYGDTGSHMVLHWNYDTHAPLLFYERDKERGYG